MISSLVKRALRMVGQGMFALRLDPLVRHMGRNHPKILLLHAVEPAERDFFRDLTVNTPPDRFAENLDWLAKRYNLISLEQLESGDIPERAAMITFDDGYRSLLTHALPLLEERAIPATVYLVTGSVDNRNLVWVNELSWLLQHHHAPAARAFAALTGLPETSTSAEFMVALQGDFAPDRAKQLIADIWADVPGGQSDLMREPALYLSWDEIRHMRERGISFGCHTVTHPSMPGLTDEQARQEIFAAREEIVAELGECTSFAYPFGHREPRIERIAIEAGFTSIMEVGGSNATLDLQHCGRVAIGDVSNARLFAQMELVVPGIARIRNMGLRLRSMLGREAPTTFSAEGA